VFGFMIINAPRIFASAWDSFLVHYDKTRDAFEGGSALTGVVSGGQMVMLALPAVGIAYSSSRAGSQAVAGGWRWSQGSAIRRLSVVSATAALIALVGFLWWPNGEYKPIQRNERGTVSGAIAQFSSIGSGRPALTPEREEELGGAPSRRDEQAPAPEEEPTSTTPTDTTSTDTATTETTTTTPATTTTPEATTTTP
jgi:hypothetical protein